MSIPTVALNEDSPAGSDAINLGDNKIREYKTQVREICEVDHDFPSTGSSLTAGQHKKVTLQEQADLGTGAVNATLLGNQTVGGKGELFYTDEDNNDIQITTAGKINSAALKSSAVADIANLMALIYPIGIVVTFGVSTNPATLLGVGTWTAIAGKVVVGINAGDAEFDTLDETGGAKTVTLTAAQSGIPAHDHSSTIYTAGGTNNFGPGISFTSYADNATASTGAAVTINNNSAAAASEAHNNLQPYIVKYVWQRVS